MNPKRTSQLFGFFISTKAELSKRFLLAFNLIFTVIRGKAVIYFLYSQSK